MVVLRFHADLSVKDIAEAMGCAAGTVKATLHQALRAMRIEFDDEDLA
jgi:RNA polymerase sigma-70 factor (ECF subfamily)